MSGRSVGAHAAHCTENVGTHRNQYYGEQRAIVFFISES